MTFRHEVGDRAPLAKSAVGRAYFSSLPGDEQQYFLKYIEKRAGDQWPQIKAGLEQAVDCYKNHGYCHSFGDWERDINGIAVPLIMNKGHIYTFNCGGPSYRNSEQYLTNEVLPQLKNMVRNIEATLIQF